VDDVKTIDGPGVFLAQFIAPEPPFDRLETLAAWAAEIGFKAVQLPTFNSAIFDLAKAAESDAYCEEVQGLLAGHGLLISELSTHRQGHVLGTHSVYGDILDVFLPTSVRGNPTARTAWAKDQLLLAARATRRLGLGRHVTMSGGLLWPFLYPYPPRPSGLVEEGFAELARRWRPILDAFDTAGARVGFELHPGEDLHDGLSFERFLGVVGAHPAAGILYDPSHLFLQHIDYGGFLDVYQDRIVAFHVKDAEWNSSAKTGVYAGYIDWLERAGRFRSPGDGDIDFGLIFSKLTQYGYSGWASLEWECCLKHPEDGARDGAQFIRDHIIRVQSRTFDAGMTGTSSASRNRKILGLETSQDSNA
jgi:sugar phosphate isomerase/epimerase